MLLELAIVAVILLLVFGYRRLPEIGRRAGEGARDLKAVASEAIGETLDPAALGRSAGSGVRELRELKQAAFEPVEKREAPASRDLDRDNARRSE